MTDSNRLNDLVARLRAPVPTVYDCKDAADALEAQARRISELESMLAVHRLAVDVDALKARIAELTAALKQSARVEASLASRIANLMDALEPFADAVDDLEDGEKGSIYESAAAMDIDCDDLRAARAAYLGEKK